MKDSNNTKKGCQDVVGVYSGFDGKKVFSGFIRCKKWSCPYCGPRKKKQLLKRLIEGPMAKSGISKYGLKFVTLTFGGNDVRKMYVVRDWKGDPLTQKIYNFKLNKYVVAPVYDSKEMYEKMADSFNKLITALKKVYGKKFNYFRIHEPHRDGVPHFHVLFAGKGIAPKSFYPHVQRLWKKYGLGFVKVNTIKDKTGRIITKFNDVQHAINYLLKYLTKDIKTAGKWKRVFSCSRNSLLKIKKKEWEIMEVIMGSFNDKGDIVEEIILRHEEVAHLHGSVDLNTFSSEFKILPFDIVGHMMQRHQKTLTLTREA